MGTDIHCYVEYSNPEFVNKDGSLIWHPHDEQERGRRDYLMFSLIWDNMIKDLPSDISKKVQREYTVKIKYDDQKVADDDDNDDEEDYTISFDEAMGYINHHDSYGSYVIVDDNGFPIAVTQPDWHTPGWLTSDMLDKLLESTETVPNISYFMILSILKTYEKFGYKSRLVFWFDN